LGNVLDKQLNRCDPDEDILGGQLQTLAFLGQMAEELLERRHEQTPGLMESMLVLVGLMESVLAAAESAVALQDPQNPTRQ
jgi:hypothetical protein